MACTSLSVSNPCVMYMTHPPCVIIYVAIRGYRDWWYFSIVGYFIFGESGNADTVNWVLTSSGGFRVPARFLQVMIRAWILMKKQNKIIKILVILTKSISFLLFFIIQNLHLLAEASSPVRKDKGSVWGIADKRVTTLAGAQSVLWPAPISCTIS